MGDDAKLNMSDADDWEKWRMRAENVASGFDKDSDVWASYLRSAAYLARHPYRVNRSQEIPRLFITAYLDAPPEVMHAMDDLAMQCLRLCKALNP